MGKQFAQKKLCLGGTMYVMNVTIDHILDIKHLLATNPDKWFNRTMISNRLNIPRKSVLVALQTDYMVNGKNRCFDSKAVCNFKHKGFSQVLNLVRFRKKKVS